MKTKLQKIAKAAAQIRKAQNVPHDVAMTWAWQCWEEWNKRETALAAIEERAAFLKRFPAAAKKARVGGVVIYSTPADPTTRALAKRAKHEAEAPAPLMSSEEYWKKKAVEKAAAFKPRAGEGPRVAA